MDNYQYRAQQSPVTDAPMNSLVSPPRNGNRMPQQDLRTTLPRRFTTDSGRVPTLQTLGSLQRPVEPQEYTTAVSNWKKLGIILLCTVWRDLPAMSRNFRWPICIPRKNFQLTSLLFLDRI